MRKYFYLFFIFYSFYNTAAQSTPAEAAIYDKLKKLALIPNKDPKQEEKLLLQLKAESEKLGYDNGILQSGDLLMRLYGLQSRNKEVLTLGDQLKKIAINKQDTYGYIANIYRKNALTLGYLGLDDASLKDFKSAIKYANTIKDNDKKLYHLSLCYQNIGLHYKLKRFENTKLRDSLLGTYKKSLELVKQISDDSKTVTKDLKYDQIAFTDMCLGMFYLVEGSTEKGSLELAEKYLMEGLQIYQDKKYNTPPDNKIMMLNQVSWLYMEKKDYQKSIDYAKQALELEKRFKDPYHRVESFEFLADSYREVNNKEKSKLYMEKYTFLKDSLAYVDKSEADATMKKMVKEVETENKENSKKQWIITGVLALLAGLITVILWRRKNKALRRKYEQMMVKLKNDEAVLAEETIEETEDQDVESESNNDLQAATNKNAIPADTKERILKRLAAFEKSEKFLKKDLTVGSLAAQLNTNTKYLSEAIKNNRSQNFNNYINSLRINYIVHKLYNEPKYREYKISYLAEECGYASSQVFVIAFKKINGLTPSYFIQNLKDDQVNAQIPEDNFS